jgi:asparagine synthase (glutamine-hydrolysing)
MYLRGKGRERPSAEAVVEALKALEARGPEHTAFLDLSPAFLGFTRLAINGLTPLGNQPFRLEGGALVCNGEIYNHADVRKELEALGKYTFRTDHSDTEMLLYAYAEWGPECVHKFYGMFAFAIYDTRDKANPVLHLCRDRVGIKPLYFARTPQGEWLFASEIKALLKHPSIPRPHQG